MTHNTISVAIATYNEADNIARCLKSVSGWVKEIIVVDGQSTDNTTQILKKFRAKIISTSNKPMFHINKQIAIDNCTGDWILQLDADEVVSPELRKEIQTIVTSSKSLDGYWINRRNYFLGRFLNKGGQYPDPTLRLYRRGRGRLPCQSVHEQATVIGTTGHLKSSLLHYADISFSRYLRRNNRYTSIIAQELQGKKLPLNLITFFDYFFVKPLFWFLLTYLRHQGYQDAFPGFIFSWYSSLRFPISYIKYYELSNSKTTISPTRDWD